jgi:hypothetical protein
MLKPKHKIEVFPGKRGGFYWRARFVGKGPMSNKIIADGSQPYSNRSNARRAARRIGRVLAFAPIVNIEVNHDR